MPEQQRHAAIRLVGAQLFPCGATFAGKVLGRLKAALVGRIRSEADTRAWATVMTEELSALPADLVDHAYGQWLRGEKYLPTPAEFIDRMEPELSTRRKTYAALQKPADAPPKPAPQRADPERIDAILRAAGYAPSKPVRTA